jgi:diaminohydroxyphosphoribosylaminopyrimidine deaminase/5-amino-6-(5-phosphoribosylamino)uracil reductase
VTAEDEARMRAALSLARRSLGRSWPNPAVGCVVGRDGRVLGRGWTQPGGRPHAEQVALAQAQALWGGEALRGATAWVSLEPCAHHGRTPPCAGALAAAGVARVVAPISDPDPRVDGRGFAALRAAGVRVDVGLLAPEARAINAGFLSRIERGRPWLALKMAATLDGRIAIATGESRWITGPAARGRVHLMRAEADAVLIGAGAARVDDPALDVRLPGFGPDGPVRVVVDPALSLPLESRLARTAGHRPLWLLHAPDAPAEAASALSSAGATLIEVAAEGRALDMAAALRALAARGVTRVLCEGGGLLAASLLRADVVDEIAWFTAGAAIGAEGAAAIGPLALSRLAAAPRFALEDCETLGPDVLSRWRRAT